MRTAFSRKQTILAAMCTLGLASGAAQAQAPGDAAAPSETWRAGALVWKNAAGDCWQTALGATVAGGCNPAPAAQYVPPVEPLAAQATPIVAKAVPPAVQRVTLDANVLFDFDKADLRPAGRDSLDAFVTNVGTLTEASPVIAVGYADRVGGEGYNQALSEARVAAVKTYLVGKGIVAGQIDTSARGETQPSTRGECDGLTKEKSIACLQPDRHVFIELSGNRLVK